MGGQKAEKAAAGFSARSRRARATAGRASTREDNFRGDQLSLRVARFKPGQRVPELAEKLGFFEQIRSVKIACAAASETPKSASRSKAKGEAASGGGKP